LIGYMRVSTADECQSVAAPCPCHARWGCHVRSRPHPRLRPTTFATFWAAFAWSGKSAVSTAPGAADRARRPSVRRPSARARRQRLAKHPHVDVSDPSARFTALSPAGETPRRVANSGTTRPSVGSITAVRHPPPEDASSRICGAGQSMSGALDLAGSRRGRTRPRASRRDSRALGAPISH